MLRVDPVNNGIIFTNGHKVEIGHAHEGGRGAEITMGFGKIKVYIIWGVPKKVVLIPPNQPF